MLYVDTRWDGNHGIGRFSREVVCQLDMPWRPLGGSMSPSSPLDVVNPRRLQLSTRDIVYSPGYNAGLSRARQILTLHDMIHLQDSSESGQAKRLYYEKVIKPAVRRARQVLTVSETSRSAIRAWLGDEGVDVINVGNGRSESFRLDGEKVDFGHPYYLYVGNSKPHKNIDVLFSALVLRPCAQLLIVSSDREDIQARAERAGVQGRVQVVSGLDDETLARYYRGASGLLFPSRMEGFGLPAVEALGCGIPVAYWSGCASLAEIVGAHGPRIDDNNSPTEWAEALDKLSSWGPLAFFDATKYEWSNVAESIGSVLRSRVAN